MARGGRKIGTPNYNNTLLISVIEEIKPNGALQWQMVAEVYHARSGEALMRNPDDIKKHWNNVLCNKLNKPTGRTGGATDRILRCIRIQGEIMKKTDSVMMGIESDDDANYMYNGVLPADDEEEDNDDDDDEEEDNTKPTAIDNTTIACLVEASMDAAPPLPLLPNNFRPAEAVAPDGIAKATAPSTGATTGTTATVGAATSTIVGADATAITMAPGVAAGAATMAAATTGAGGRKKKPKVVNEKTKNSSNVNKERGSIRKTMDRLADALISRPACENCSKRENRFGTEKFRTCLERVFLSCLQK